MSLDRVEGGYRLSDDRRRLDLELIHAFIAKESYWARGVPRGTLERAINNSLVFGVYEASGVKREAQVGFARVVTDFATFAYLADVFILPAHRGLGLGKRLVEAVITHPELQGFRRWLLATQDAHELYERFGFTPLSRPDALMERHDPEVYLRRGADQGIAAD